MIYLENTFTFFPHPFKKWVGVIIGISFNPEKFVVRAHFLTHLIIIDPGAGQRLHCTILCVGVLVPTELSTVLHRRPPGGFPKTPKELIHPLHLSLWDWGNFSKELVIPRVLFYQS